MTYRFLMLAASMLLSAAAAPPGPIPVPQEKPKSEEAPSAAPQSDRQKQETSSPPPAENTVPKPEEKPETPVKQDSAPAGDGRLEEKKPADGKRTEEKKAEQPAPEPVRQENPEELKACLSDLKAIGAQFREIDTIKGEEEGCGIASPLELSVVIPGIKLEPEGTMRCEAALALSRWAKNVVVPAAEIAMPGRHVTAFGNASTYVCRNRNSAETGKISEHAKGNAVDIATMTFDRGEPLVMKPRDEDGTMEGAFQRSITTAACLFFRTVLSPGSDASHQDHLHLDALERKGGYLYCR